MDKRTCPNCGKVWFSADTVNHWECDKCGALIPAPQKRRQFKS
ncbi:hypothetical protein BR63_05775 [Thermanaerosceptrum fracticalcis]|uniref:Small ribosomal subunit protein eS31 domain-containing protein n=1 Tax=Thermanaerosceptrum fracticalcis TaxID=1712410 RepID=A0A7G6E1B3_THEFR|nr:hypothetical protein BR63_05775 [Thermanaerosceptrum fracticalcis]